MQLNRSTVTLLLSVFVLLGSTSVRAQSSDRATLLKEIESLRGQLKLREDALLEPSAEDRASFAEFLQQADTGLLRLLPREEYDAKKTLTINGGGAYYSFARLTHEYGYGSDISLEMGKLSVGFAGADYGLLANLGAVPLEDLTPDTPAVQPLASLVPPTSLPKARVEQRRASDGIQVENVLYKQGLPAVVGNTYVLRSVCYDDSDVLVAFRVVRKDSDGSLILAWKMLKRYPVTRLERTAG
jgi:hypothetical protein